MNFFAAKIQKRFERWCFLSDFFILEDKKRVIFPKKR